MHILLLQFAETSVKIKQAYSDSNFLMHYELRNLYLAVFSPFHLSGWLK